MIQPGSRADRSDAARTEECFMVNERPEMLEKSATLYFGPWYRQSPFFKSALRAGCTAFDIYNHMYIPGYFDDPVTEYRLLNEAVTMWDVGCERTVEVAG